MNWRYLRVGTALAIVAFMAVACLPLASSAPGSSYSLLTPEELAFAKAVGRGEYA
jgi:hypothetical protein